MVLIGSRIKELRNAHRFTQTELANLVGVTKSTIAAYENDSRSPSYDVLIKLASVFHVSTDYLLLNRSGVTFDIEGLDRTQIAMLERMIAYFKRSNRLNDFYKKQPANIQRILKPLLDNEFPLE